MARLLEHDIDAVIFDVDGVLTRTARIHARAWKAALDPLLARCEQTPFDKQADYRRYVDGKSRSDGLRSFLTARGIALSEGDANALGARKNALYLKYLESGDVEVYEGALAFVRALRSRGVRTAAVTASRNGAAVLRAAGVLPLFDARVDGIDADREGLAGKPAPDLFLHAAALLGVTPARAAVVEDALAGVEAGRAGGFALVIGVERAGQAAALRAHGATHVVRDLAALPAEAQA